jgi:hypothetical protein
VILLRQPLNGQNQRENQGLHQAKWACHECLRKQRASVGDTDQSEWKSHIRGHRKMELN